MENYCGLHLHWFSHDAGQYVSSIGHWDGNRSCCKMGNHYPVCRNSKKGLFRFKTAGNIPPLLYGRCCHGLPVSRAFVESIPGSIRCSQNAWTDGIYTIMDSTPTGINCDFRKNLLSPGLVNSHSSSGRFTNHPESGSVWSGVCIVSDYF